MGVPQYSAALLFFVADLAPILVPLFGVQDAGWS
ncbi:hypothetical protein CGMCC3_g2954 [Colletotrichum fructicola]|nr:uncharacterized protein CGMCC3_g2954 [Colletotrichum fructicola]KAE9580996.1 hypothetical protein CGMCC3_g2954 [Colletotrichum fructicola]